STVAGTSIAYEGHRGGGGGAAKTKNHSEGRGSGAHGPRKLTIAVKPLSTWGMHQGSGRDMMERRGSALNQPYRLVDPFQIERDEQTHQKPTYISNAIHTSKYTFLNFLPLCLLQEFRRAANLYFLAIAILQSIKQISPLTPITAIAPLVMVVSVSLLREAIEERKKRAYDGIMNAKSVVVMRNFEEQHTVWESIQVGDLIRIHERDPIPADGIILASSEDNGTCYIDTSNLDGEANLKSRQSLRSTLSLTFDTNSRDKTKYFIKCEQPDQDLYRFAGNLSVDSKMYSLSEKQFLLRGSTLMNTKWIVMLVVYTGHDTKIMKNARAAHHKLSHLEIQMSQTVVFVFFIQTVTYTLTFQILRVIHFSSDRKRMSIIVRDENGGIRLFCKGADSVILERCERFLSDKDEMMSHVTQFAEEGYRILLFAERELDEGYYKTWEGRYDDAELDIHSKESKTGALVDELEQHFTLIGASAVEDKLQVGVPETISLFQKAGIKESQALLVDGSALTLALLPCNCENFLKLALQSATVIVCRASPIQKALVVELVKSGVPDVTLAVGDGANDVSMIRAAHVGVGVMGQEGMQAVRSADYAVQQFSHLGRLLLFHGRLSYLRTSQCIDYFFYKNIVFTLPQFIYGACSAFSAQTFYCDIYITAYNVIFTALPVITRSIMDTDLLEAIASKFPELYRFGASGMFMSPRTFAKAAGLATFHAVVTTVVPLVLMRHMNLEEGGGFWSASVASFFYIVPIESSKGSGVPWWSLRGSGSASLCPPSLACYPSSLTNVMAFLRRKKPNVRVPTGKDAVNFRKLLFLPIKDTEDLLTNQAWERLAVRSTMSDTHEV
ncbi:hypothetical protein BBP00_00005860, partial [Phytophthora kernoviae]